jgi:hypothetical protein
MPSPPPLAAAQMEKSTNATASPPHAYPIILPTVSKPPCPNVPTPAVSLDLKGGGSRLSYGEISIA